MKVAQTASSMLRFWYFALWILVLPRQIEVLARRTISEMFLPSDFGLKFDRLRVELMSCVFVLIPRKHYAQMFD